MTFRKLDLICKTAKVRSGMTRILDTAFNEKRGLTLAEELEWDSLSAQLTQVEAELEERRRLEHEVNQYVLTSGKNGNQ